MTLYLSSVMDKGFNIAAMFKQVQTVFNHISTDTASNQDLGGSHSLLTLFSTINNSFSASERFQEGKTFKKINQVLLSICIVQSLLLPRRRR